MKAILSLYDLSGQWSQPYRDAGYFVIQVDQQLDANWHEGRIRSDVRLLRYSDVMDMYRDLDLDIIGVLAAPPCTMFAASGNRHIRSDAEMTDALSMVDAVYRLVQVFNPFWWALENPVGKLSSILGKPRMYFDPCDYAGYLRFSERDEFELTTKRTCLWGEFNEPVKKRCEPLPGGSVHWRKFGGKSQATKNARSRTPRGFARAFFEANR